MKVLLISANRERVQMPPFPLGLSCIAAAAEGAGHDVRVLDYLSETEPETALRRTLADFTPDAIGIGVRNIDSQNMLMQKFLLEGTKEAVEICRAQSRAPVILGGAGYSIYPVDALEYCGADMGIEGEGEAAFPLLLSRIERGEPVDDTPGLVLPGRGVAKERHNEKNLDAFPLPDYGVWAHMPDKQSIWLPVQSRRGCPMDCGFCSTAAIEGRAVRKRSPAQVARNIASGVNAGFRNFFFSDNTFNFPPSYAKALCREIIASGMDIKWRCILYPLNVDDELAGLMARAGCASASVSFESGCERILTVMNKKFTLDDVRLVNEILARHGIERDGFMLLGSPGETKDSVEETVAFADSLQMEMVKIAIGVRLYPRTKYAEIALREGRISSEKELLQPRFYMVDELDQWLRESAPGWAKARPGWIL